MSKGERQIAKILSDKDINFVTEKTFPNLRRKGLLRFDFYISNLDGAPVIIEFDGQFHFKPIKGRAALIKQQEYDRRKNDYCLAYDIKLIRIPYWELKNLTFEKIFNTEEFIVKSKWHTDMLMRKMDRKY